MPEQQPEAGIAPKAPARYPFPELARCWPIEPFLKSPSPPRNEPPAPAEWTPTPWDAD